MKKFLICLVMVLFLGCVAYAQVGASFTLAPKKTEPTNLHFGLSVDIVRFGDAIAIGFDWGLFKSNPESKNLFGWCFRLYLSNGCYTRLAIPIGYDFRNRRAYIGLGIMFK